MFGKGMMKKVLMFLFIGPISFLMGGGMNMMDFFLIPMIAPMFKGIFGSLGMGGALGGAVTT